jgi:hypothetical protein
MAGNSYQKGAGGPGGSRPPSRGGYRGRQTVMLTWSETDHAEGQAGKGAAGEEADRQPKGWLGGYYRGTPVELASLLDRLHHGSTLTQVPAPRQSAMRGLDRRLGGNASGVDLVRRARHSILDRLAQDNRSTGNASANNGEDQRVFSSSRAALVAHEITDEFGHTKPLSKFPLRQAPSRRVDKIRLNRPSVNAKLTRKLTRLTLSHRGTVSLGQVNRGRK